MSRFRSTTPLLKSLHWLPIEFRIKFKSCLLIYKALNTGYPKYLNSCLQPYTSFRSIRMSNPNLNLLATPFVSTRIHISRSQLNWLIDKGVMTLGEFRCFERCIYPLHQEGKENRRSNLHRANWYGSRLQVLIVVPVRILLTSFFDVGGNSFRGEDTLQTCTITWFPASLSRIVAIFS